MLRTRIITALILAPLVLAAVIWVPSRYLAVVFWLVAAAGCYEWAALAGLHKPLSRLLYVALFGVLAAVVYLDHGLFPIVLLIGCGVWAFAAGCVLMFPRGTELFKKDMFVAVLGMLVLLPAWVALVVIHGAADGYLWLIWLFFLAWGADIGAYFAGRAFGRHKLAPSVSPGKTWEGVCGGVLLALVVCAPGAFLLTPAWLYWVPLIVFLVGVSVFGDLFESVLKRTTGVKDSGSLLPGHGGLLDRIDSLLAVLPVFAAALPYLLAGN